jgi:hypothetical protein
VQVPNDPGTSQAAHCPAHVVLQHTPSMQCALAQSVSATHASPSTLRGTHAPPTHVVVEAQSEGEVHDVAHAPAAVHTPYGAHDLVPCGAAAPTSEHVPTFPDTSHA